MTRPQFAVPQLTDGARRHLALAPQPTTRVEPAQAALEQWRNWRAGAYVCDPLDGRWHAACPVCGSERGVRIDEPRPGGSIIVRCKTGCSAEEIGRALDNAFDHADPWAHAEAWARVAHDLQTLAHDQAKLIAGLTAPTVQAVAA